LTFGEICCKDKIVEENWPFGSKNMIASFLGAILDFWSKFLWLKIILKANFQYFASKKSQETAR
jgi:hypothetical protein